MSKMTVTSQASACEAEKMEKVVMGLVRFALTFAGKTFSKRLLLFIFNCCALIVLTWPGRFFYYYRPSTRMLKHRFVPWNIVVIFKYSYTFGIVIIVYQCAERSPWSLLFNLLISSHCRWLTRDTSCRLRNHVKKFWRPSTQAKLFSFEERLAVAKQLRFVWDMTKRVNIRYDVLRPVVIMLNHI